MRGVRDRIEVMLWRYFCRALRVGRIHVRGGAATNTLSGRFVSIGRRKDALTDTEACLRQAQIALANAERGVLDAADGVRALMTAATNLDASNYHRIRAQRENELAHAQAEQQRLRSLCQGLADEVEAKEREVAEERARQADRQLEAAIIEQRKIADQVAVSARSLDELLANLVEARRSTETAAEEAARLRTLAGLPEPEPAPDEPDWLGSVPRLLAFLKDGPMRPNAKREQDARQAAEVRRRQKWEHARWLVTARPGTARRLANAGDEVVAQLLAQQERDRAAERQQTVEAADESWRRLGLPGQPYPRP